MELCQKSPAAEKALSASTLVGGNDFSAIRIMSKAGGSFPVASKLANCRLISGSTPVEDWKENHGNGTSNLTLSHKLGSE